MKVLYTGVSGLIGRYFVDSNPDVERNTVLGTSLRGRSTQESSSSQGFSWVQAPFQDRPLYLRLLDSFKPDFVVHAGAEGNVDAVESDSDTARLTNLEFPLFLLEETNRRGLAFVNFSSNAIYDGVNPPFSETSVPNPLNAYGKLKVTVDAEVAKNSMNLNFRPTVTYGWNFKDRRSNPVSFFLPLMQDKKPIKLATDVIENPVYAGDVAAVLWKCLKLQYVGSLNVGGGDDAGISRFDWLRTAASVFDCESAIEPVKAAAFPMKAPRPLDTHFNIQRLKSDLSYQPLTVRQGAEAMRLDRRRSHCSR